MKRITEETNTYIDSMYSLSELCRELSISISTGRNWVKLGKVVPQYTDKKKAYFSKQYIKEVKNALQSGDNKALKSRRNKKYVSGNALYNSYVSEGCANVRVVQELLGVIEEYGIEITDDMLQVIIAECAIQLFVQRVGIHDGARKLTSGVLKKYLDGDISLGIYNSLIDELIINIEEAQKYIQTYPRIFELSYVYETGEDILGLLYISCRNMGSRKASGAYYTPTKIVKQLVEQLEGTCDKITSDSELRHENGQKAVIDPCCGTGNFLLQLPDTFSVENIYGNDIDNISVEITRINMALKYKVQDIDLLCENITVGNFLADDSNMKYDYIIGNPPWGYEFSEAECGFLRENYQSAVGKNIESYDVFVERALSKLKTDGEVSFVLPEAIMNVKSHMPIRKLIAERCSIQYLAYLGNVFHKVQCPSIILQLQVTERAMSTVGMRVKYGSRCFVVKTERRVNHERFNFKMTDKEYNIIQKMKSMPDVVYLKDNATFALGIVTGNNEEYITHKKDAYNEIVLKGSDIERYRINAHDNYVLYQPDGFQQVAPTEYYRATEKLLYRFIGDKLVFAYDDKQTLTLNSCNILIPHIEGLDMKYILAVLNSSVAQFFYEKEFGSVKVLRSHIEQIPIPRVDRAEQEEIVRLVELLILGKLGEDEAERIYGEIDEKIRKGYRL